MARDDPQFRIRLPADLKDWVEEMAAKNHRSLNAEIVHLIDAAKSEHDFFSGDMDDGYSEEAEKAVEADARVQDGLEKLTNSDLLEILAERLTGRRR
jgi:hypothetical protein